MHVLAKLPLSFAVFATLACGLPLSALAQGGLIRDRREIPDDPLAGLGEDSGGRRPGTGRTKANKDLPRCQLLARAADPNAIGDLRAMVLAARHAPKQLPCESGQAAKGDLRLRLVISGQGKVERGEVLGGDPRLGNLVLAKLSGGTCAPRPQGGTEGEIILAVKAPKRPS